MGERKETRVLAVDYGASSGRVILGRFDGEKLVTEELHRFLNEPVTVNGTMYWDVLRLFHEMKQGILKAARLLDGEIDSVGIDTWGVDFCLLDKDGELLGNPVHYRDSRTNGMLEKALETMEAGKLYQFTGNQLMEINTLFQLIALKQNKPEVLERAETLLCMPDALAYFLSGEKTAECSIASTTQMYNAEQKAWSKEVLEAYGLPEKIFQPVQPTGKVLGTLSESIQKELMIQPAKVISVCGHDTQSAQVAVPATEEDFLFLSCGTWSLFGTELNAPLMNEEAFAHNITNEQGYGGKTSFLKNIIGLWLIQESRRQWIREGKEYSFGELEKMANEAEPFVSFIDPDAPEFVPEGNIPERIREYCIRTGQKAPQTPGEVVRCINQSLALKYRSVKEEICACTKKDYNTLYMIGGGIQSKLLCQLTASACECKVSAGPTEATVFGNMCVQLISLGKIADLAEARKIVMQSEEYAIYEPQDKEKWAEAYARYCDVLKKA